MGRFFNIWISNRGCLPPTPNARSLASILSLTHLTHVQSRMILMEKVGEDSDGAKNLSPRRTQNNVGRCFYFEIRLAEHWARLSFFNLSFALWLTSSGVFLLLVCWKASRKKKNQKSYREPQRDTKRDKSVQEARITTDDIHLWPTLCVT